MTDRFLDEVRRMHQSRADLRRLTPERRVRLAASIGDDAAGEWMLTARDAQLPPPDLDFCWLFCGGRGCGKSKSLSGAVHTAIRAGIKRINFIAPTTADFHDVNLEGASGIMVACGHDPPPRWVASHRRLEWPNGARVRFYTAEEPESLRGHEAELVMIDEIGRCRYQQEIFDMAMLGLRLGDRPRMLIATTPRTTPFMKKLVAMKGVSITTGTTYDNAKHLAPAFLFKIRELYEGTRLGRQELQGAMILDPEDALFKDSWLIHDDVPESTLEKVSIGVDPSGGGDECGIVVCARLTDGRFAVLADRTVRGSPGTWGDAAVKAAEDFDADNVCCEVNFGGAMAAEVIRQTAQRLHSQGKRASALISVIDVHASRGKVLRAEPISLIYEKGKVLHRRGLDLLEAELLSFSRNWDRATDGSPNRFDSLVWSLTHLSSVKRVIMV